MELNYECLRQTLKALENNLKLSNDLDFYPVGINEIINYPELKNKHDPRDIAYCVYMLVDAGMVNVLPTNSYIKELRIQTITYRGHEFLQQIKNDTVWKKIIDILKPIGVFSIDIISKVAVNVLTEMIKTGVI